MQQSRLTLFTLNSTSQLPPSLSQSRSDEKRAVLMLSAHFPVSHAEVFFFYQRISRHSTHQTTVVPWLVVVVVWRGMLEVKTELRRLVMHTFVCYLKLFSSLSLLSVFAYILWNIYRCMGKITGNVCHESTSGIFKMQLSSVLSAKSRCTWSLHNASSLI
jgi:hypothetical protein